MKIVSFNFDFLLLETVGREGYFDQLRRFESTPELFRLFFLIFDVNF